MTVIRLTASGRAHQSYEDETDEMEEVFSWLLQSKGNDEGNISVLGQESSHGQPRALGDLGHHGRWAIRAHPRTNVEGQSLGNGLVGGAVEEVKAKIRTLRYKLERGLKRTVPENHDTLAQIVQPAAATIN